MIKKILKSIQITILRIYFRSKHVYIHPKAVFDKKTFFAGYSKVYENSSLINCQIGLGTYIASNCQLVNVNIGKYSSIAPNVSCIIGNHPTKIYVSTHPAFFSNKKQAGFTFTETQKFEEISYANKKFIFEIGNDVWIGQNCMLMNGITIGDGAIIASGSIVLKDVPPYEIWGGVPSRKIKDRFELYQKDILLKFQWWNKPMEWLKSNVDCFENIEEFIDVIKRNETK
jgi:acetyltransferase-like isoleucine patch superfamily enzyme